MALGSSPLPIADIFLFFDNLLDTHPRFSSHSWLHLNIPSLRAHSVVCVHPPIPCTVTYHLVPPPFFFPSRRNPTFPVFFFIPLVQVSAAAAYTHIHAFTPFMCITYIQPSITYHFVELGQIEPSSHFKTAPTDLEKARNLAGS